MSEPAGAPAARAKDIADGTSTGRARRSSRAEATRAEIVSVARRLLNEKRELSLRAVAAEMGVSAPALYRYVASVNQLITMVAAETLLDVTAEVAKECAPYYDEPISEVAVGAVAFRHWALTHPEEFRVVFTTTRTFERSQRDDLVTGRQEADARFMGQFASIFARAIRNLGVRVPQPNELGPEVAKALEQRAPWMDGMPEDAPLGMLWLFQLDFTKLYGCICLEVFGFVQQDMIENGSLFIATLREIGFSMALGEAVERATVAARSEVVKLLQRDGMLPTRPDAAPTANDAASAGERGDDPTTGVEPGAGDEQGVADDGESADTQL